MFLKSRNNLLKLIMIFLFWNYINENTEKNDLSAKFLRRFIFKPMHFCNYACSILKRILLNLIHFPKKLAKVMCGCFKVVWHYTCRLFCCCFGCFRKKKIKSIDLQGVGDYMKKCKNVIVMTGAGISTNAGISLQKFHL